MTAFQLNDQEMSHLYGLPHLQQLLYIRGIRPYMDFATGIVGIKRKISYQSLKEEVYIEPRKGPKPPSISRDCVRRGIKGLINAGVIANQSAEKQLIFQCIHATWDFSGSNQPALNSSQQPASRFGIKTPENTPNYNKNISKPTTPENAKPATPPVSDNFNHSLSCGELVSKDYKPSIETIQQAMKHGCEKVTCIDEVAKFISHYVARGTKRADWDAEFMTWLLRDKRYQHEKITKSSANNKHKRKTLSAVDRVILANQQYLGRIIDA
jgi:hypothetical protein